MLKIAFAILAALILRVVRADEISAADQFLDVNYRFEVAGYCGLVNNEVARGFHAERKRLLARFELSEEQQQTVRGKAWQAAHKEWLNRGLGGFRRWCRNEGAGYATDFTRLGRLQDTE